MSHILLLSCTCCISVNRCPLTCMASLFYPHCSNTRNKTARTVMLTYPWSYKQTKIHTLVQPRSPVTVGQIWLPHPIFFTDDRTICGFTVLVASLSRCYIVPVGIDCISSLACIGHNSSCSPYPGCTIS